MMRVLLMLAGAVACLYSGCGGMRGKAEVRGAARVGKTVYAWGDGLRIEAERARMLHTGRQFTAAGCAADLDGSAGLVLQEGQRLVWLHGKELGETAQIDDEAAMSDCLTTTLLGHRGVLVAHRGLQVRFYERPEKPAERWPYREIYSFYTASYQAGLLLRDVDGDGREDIVCGNYWIQSPAEFTLPWRLFAINTYYDTEQAAHVRLGMWLERLVVSQRESHPARLALFRPAADPKVLWLEERLDSGLELNRPGALAVSQRGLIVGENGGAGRILLWDGTVRGRELARGEPVVAVFWDRPEVVIAVRRDGIERIAVPLQ